MILKIASLRIVPAIFILLFPILSLFPEEQPEMMIQLGHSMEINTVCFSPNGRYILSGSSDTSISLWDVYTGKEMRKLNGHSGFVYSVCFSPDGNYALSSGRDYNIILWEVATGEAITTYTDKTAHVLSLAFASDGTSAFMARSDKTIMRLDLLSGKVIGVFYGHTSFINTIVVSPEGDYMLSGGGDKNVILWNIAKEEPEKIFRGHTLGIHGVTFSPDKKYVLSGGGFLNEGELILWDRKTGEKLKSFSGHTGYITSVHFSADGRNAVSTSYDKTIKLWDIATGEEKQTLTAHSDEIKSACFSPDNSYFLSSDTNRNMILWETDTWQEMKRFRGYSGHVNSVCYSPDGRYVATGGEAKVITLWDLEQGRRIRNFTGHEREIQSICFSPDGTRLISAGNDTMVKVWDVKTGECVRTLKGHSDFVFSVCFSPDGTYALSGGRDNRIILWDMTTGTALRTIEEHTNYVSSVAFSPDSRYFVSGSGDKTIKLWDTTTGSLIKTFTGHTWVVDAVCFSPDGTRILSGGLDYQAILWDVKTGKRLRTFSGHSRVVDTVCFSKDGKEVFTGSWDSTIKRWESETGKEIQTYTDHMRRVNEIAISPNGNYLISGSDDNRTMIRNLTTGDAVSLVSSDNLEDWLIYSEDGYWDSSVEGGNVVAMVRGMEAWNIDQFAVRFNRPDILLKKTGSPDTTLMAYYYGQHQKRLKKLKIDNKSLSGLPHVPEVFLQKVTTHDKYAKIQCLFKDSLSTIISYAIYVNDVPIFGAYGKPLSGKEISIKEKIELSTGNNKIEVSCLNETGAESYRALAYASYNKKVKGDLYFIGFGVSEYHDPGLTLKFAHKDVKDLAKLFQGMQSAYGKVYIKTYLNKEVTPNSIKNAKKFVKNSSVDDTFVLFISGHGVHDTDENATYYYLTYNADVKNLPGTTVKFEDIESLVQGVGARKKLFLMDTCESGEIEEDVEQNYYDMADAKGLAPRTTKRDVMLRKKIKRSYLFDQDRYIYNDLLRRSGAIVFSSSRGGELSYESDVYSNGLFTDAIISCLTSSTADEDNNGMIMIDELKRYVCKKVPELTNGMQNPTVDRDNIYVEFGFPAGNNKADE